MLLCNDYLSYLPIDMYGQPLPDNNMSLAQLALLRRVALIFSSSLELDDALANAIGACLPAIGDFGFFDVVLGDEVRRAAGAYEDPALQTALADRAWCWQERTGVSLCALTTGKAVLHANMGDPWLTDAFGKEPRIRQFHSIVSAPIFHGDELIGSLTLFMGRSGRRHSQADLDLASELTSLAAPSIVKARLLAQQRVLSARLKERVAARTSERDPIWRLSKDLMAEVNFNDGFTAVNPSFSCVLGWSCKQAQALSVSSLLHPEDLAPWTSQIDRLAGGQKQSEVEGRWKSKDGGYLWLSWTLVAELDAIYCIGRDVTRLHRKQEEIQHESEVRFQLALQVGGLGAWQWNIVENKVTWWPGMAELHGMPPGFQLSQVQDYLSLVHPDDRELTGRYLGGELDENAGKGIEYRVISPDGNIRWLEGRGEVTRTEQGVPVTMSGVCADITERKLTEQRLRFVARASAELAELVDHELTMARIAGLAVPDFADWCTVDLLEGDALKRVAVTHVDPDKVALAHELHRRYPPDRAASTGPWQVIRSGEAALVAEISDEMLSESIKDQDYLQIVRALGLRSYIGVPLTVRGKTIGVLTFISAESRHLYTPRDVEIAEEIARRAHVAIDNSILYRTLQENDRRKDEFLAMLGHELRNPLAPISAAAQLLVAQSDPAEVRSAGQVIARQVAHMTALVDDLLDVSRVTRGDVLLTKEAIDLRTVVQAAIEQVRPLCQQKSQYLSVSLGQDPLPVEGDHKRLVQSVSNVLNNAAKYTQAGGDIHVHAEHEIKEVKVSIRDNGVGMPAALIHSVFDLFVQGATTVDRTQGGLGIGLALVKHLVGLHGGAVTAHSAGPGSGSLFVIRLPSVQALLPARDAQHATPPPLRTPLRKRILLVDDNVDAALMLSIVLEAAGHEVELAHHPFDALAQLSGPAFDVILLDVGLPDLDGKELARRIRAERLVTQPLIIGVSGYGQDSDRASALAAGMSHYMVKPVNTAQLMMLMNEDGENRVVQHVWQDRLPTN